MAHIIAQPCIGTKDTACVAVCPVDCIHPTKDDADFATAENARPPFCRRAATRAASPGCPKAATVSRSIVDHGHVDRQV